MGIHQGYETEATFHLLHSGKRVHVPGDVDILICLRVGAPGGSYPRTHGEAFQRVFKLAGRVATVKTEVLLPTVCLSKFG